MADFFLDEFSAGREELMGAAADVADDRVDSETFDKEPRSVGKETDLVWERLE